MFSRLHLCYELRKPKCVVQSPSRVQLVVTPWTAARQTSQSLTISQNLLRFMSIALVMPSMPSCHGDAMPLTSSSPSALNLSQNHSLFQWVSCWHQLAKLLKLSLDNSNRAALLHQSVQFSSVAQSCPTLCDPMNRSTPGLPVHHQLPEFTQTHVHWVSDAIHPSHPLSSPSPPAPNPSQYHSLFQWVNSLHDLAKVLEFQL